jgi:DNA primase
MKRVHHVKNEVSPSSFYRAELPAMPAPRGGGWRDGGLCPFHNDRQSGSFRVNLDTGAFICFACGSKGGDIVAFLQQRDGLSFHRAAKKIANEWGL